TTKRERLVDAYADGALTRADLEAREPKLKAEIARLTRAVAEAQARQVAGQADAERHTALVAYCKLASRGMRRFDPAQRQAFVRKVLTRVVVHGDRVEVQGVFQLGLTTPDDRKPQRPQGGVMVTPSRRSNQYSLRLTLDLGGASCQS